MTDEESVLLSYPAADSLGKTDQLVCSTPLPDSREPLIPESSLPIDTPSLDASDLTFKSRFQSGECMYKGNQVHPLWTKFEDNTCDQKCKYAPLPPPPPPPPSPAAAAAASPFPPPPNTALLFKFPRDPPPPLANPHSLLTTEGVALLQRTLPLLERGCGCFG
eukprot:2632122-Rhodomonas_salina.2